MWMNNVNNGWIPFSRFGFKAPGGASHFFLLLVCALDVLSKYALHCSPYSANFEVKGKIGFFELSKLAVICLCFLNSSMWHFFFFAAWRIGDYCQNTTGSRTYWYFWHITSGIQAYSIVGIGMQQYLTGKLAAIINAIGNCKIKISAVAECLITKPCCINFLFTRLWN